MGALGSGEEVVELDWRSCERIYLLIFATRLVFI